MSLINYIITFIILVHSTSVVSKNKNELSLELELPAFVKSLLGIDKSLKTFRAALGPLKANSNSNDLALSLSASNATDVEIQGRPRASDSYDQNFMRLNIRGVDDAAIVVRSILKPINEMGTQAFLKMFFGSMRRSEEVRPNVELGPGAIKSEIITYPENFLAKRLKHLLKIQAKKQEEEKYG